ncbi:YPDG domain-containing protein [Corynebacterium coyleae]|uniref:YPDG domain-containing protein n=1 Tax=Corynebacterium coyleae TaxID=53374 RepID=UPI0025515419|nr:YPDG domain-containing protein [Corynebacterium coyleae]MDK8664372.1 YPDG domain-containing protein [Corynebacterium coyleae]MDK8707921.1 YPDG domain-containing protein [Corynebacterium coyleae]MDK8734782.1 YPDG domain-containing protein [Corynebacterium coyleae]MDK8893433.1 YPDG domain-containing protein [Corynebacterium coyleae]
MKKNYISRRRGTSIAAAALSFALVAPFAQPVAFAQEEAPAAESEQNSPAPVVDENGIIDADMIASGRVTKAANLTDAHGVGKGLISGHVYLTTPGGNPGAAYDNGNVKLDGITVYAQFRDKDGSYSPIFKAQTHTLPDVVGGNGGQGTFAFGTGDKGITWTDKLGREHTWSARTDQKHRIWVEPFTNERGNNVVMFRQANGFVPGSFNGVVEGPLGSFVAADGNIQLMAAFLQEVPPSHKESWMAAKGDKLVEDPEGPIDLAATQTKVPNTVSGRVWLETGGPDKGIVATGPSYNGIDEPADGYTVYASTLTKDGAAANQVLHEQYKNDPAKLAEATKQMLEDNPEYILKTVYGKTDNEGRYTLRFGNYEKGQVREDILNPNHMFVWVENKDGVVQNGYTGFHTPIFQRFNGGGNFKAAASPGENQLPINFNGLPYQELNSLYNVNYAVMPYTPVSITADYNATDKPAAPGVTVTPEFHGNLSTLPSKVEWRDAKGNVLKECELDQSKGIKAQVAACTFDIPDDAKKGDFFNVVLVSGGNDVSAWTVLVTRDADEYTPSYEDKLVVPGEETKSAPTFTKVDEDGNETEEKVDAPEGSKFAIPGDFKAPEGYVVTIDENTGEITVTFPDKSKLNKDTVEEFDVPVVVTYPDGSTDDATAKFKLDTDGDGTPDTEDPDDDGDGIPDDKEIDDDTNPKVPNQNLDYEPEYTDVTGKPGEDVKVDKPTFKDKDGNPTTPPEGTTFTPGENVPDGVTIDENTGEITVTIPEDAKPGGKITVPVVVTYPDGTKDNVDVTVTVTDKDKGLYEPSYEDKLVVPGKETKSSPTFTDKDGKDATAPEGSTFKITDGFTAPEGYVVEIDENTGEITVTFPDKSKLNADTVEEFDVPVTLTYPDKSTDDATANFKLDTDGDGTPDTEDPDDDGDGIPDEKEKEDKTNPKVPNQNLDYEPEYEDGSGKPGEDVKVDKPVFKDKDGNPTTPPEGTKFTPGENVPDGVTIDENTGEITVTIPEDAKPGDKITVPVVVTYPDGTKDNVNVTVTVTDKDADLYEPSYEDKLVVPGKETKSSPSFTGKDGKDATAPEGSTFKITDGFSAPEGYVVTIDENSGEITVTFPDKSKLNADTVEEFDVPVTVTYPDTSVDKTTAKFKLDTDGDGTPDTEDPDDDGDGIPDEKEKEDKTNPKVPNQNLDYEPEYKDGSGKPGEDVKVDKPEFKDKDGNPTTPPEGTTFTPGENTPDGVTIDKNTGEITVTIPKDAKPGDKITVPVEVTYPDGSKDNVDVTVTVDNPDAKTADEIEPEYKDGSGKPGEDVTVPAPEFKDKDGNPTTPPEGTTFTPGENTPDGVTIDKNTGEITVTIPKDAKPGDKITVPVEVTYPDGSKDNVDVTVTVDNPDKSVDEGADTTPPKINPIKPDDKTITGTGDRPGEDIIVTFPDGKEVPTKTDENGNWTVTVPGGTTLKPGDDVKARDGVGNESKEKVGIDTGKCVATSVGFGLPLIALLPIGLATQLEIPGLSDIAAQANAQIQNFNTQMQRQLGVFNPQMASQVDAINSQLARYGTDIGTVLGGLALIAAGILAGTIIYDNCSPNGGSSIKNLELRGSSGNTYAGSSKEGKEK